MTGPDQHIDDAAVARARAAFAASVVVRIARLLHERGQADDHLIAELAAIAADCGRQAGTEQAAEAMARIQADLRAPGRSPAPDSARTAEEIAHDAQVAAHRRAG
jgi:hypothetical protein